MDPRQIDQHGAHILYDADRLTPPDERLFDPDALARSGRLIGRPGGGRGSACFLEVEGIPAVLRPYRRGGVLAPWLGDRYPRGRLATSRPWREWHLLARLYTEGFPVPAPLAARVRPRGWLYRGDLLIERLTAQTLVERLREYHLDPELWARIGHCIGQLHRRGVDHADLNAHNILITPDETVYIIDLDRARLRRAGSWCRRNLDRLRRSLVKLQGDGSGLPPVAPEDWKSLEEGWQAALKEDATPHGR